MTTTPPSIELNIDIDKVCRVIDHARAFEGEMAVIDDDTGGAPAGPDTVLAAARSYLSDMNEDEQCALVALTWVGRGTYGPHEWADALTVARQEHNDHTDDYLLGMPLLATYLEDGLDAFDLSCGDVTT